MIGDLRNLETYVEVVDRLSFADAGRRLGVPASTVTTRIKALESQLGVRLLERSTRTVAPTAEGKIFAQHCRSALNELALGQEALGAASNASGLVRVSIPTAFPAEKFASLIREFREEWPGISVQIFVEDRTVSFIEDGIDLALRGRDPGGNGLISRRIIDEEVIFIAPVGRLEDRELPILRPLSRRASDQAVNGVATRSLNMACALVAQGQARAYLPRPVCERALSERQIEEGIGPDKPGELLSLYLVYQDLRLMSKRVELLKDHLIRSLSVHT
jgi:DNA-binding transcriptional LysR family regulator